MRCPECGEEAAEGSTACGSCSTELGGEAKPSAQASAAAAPARPRRRLSRFAVIALLAACAAPWMQVLRDGAGGKWAPSDPAVLFAILTGFDVLGLAFFVIAILLGAVALMQVLVNRSTLRGWALALGGLMLGLGGMMSERLEAMLRGTPAADVVAGMAGGAGIYNWVLTAVIVVEVVVIEIMLGIGGRGPAEA